MVFESVVTDVLNRFLGDYVENLDSKQLKIGIWGGMFGTDLSWTKMQPEFCFVGDVVLKDLLLKPSALEELDLPVQTVYGKLGRCQFVSIIYAFFHQRFNNSMTLTECPIFLEPLLYSITNPCRNTISLFEFSLWHGGFEFCCINVNLYWATKNIFCLVFDLK